MPDAPIVSVYIVNHNYGRFIRRAIESVLAQVYEDWELLIIDDGSTDESREIIEAYRGLSRIRLIYQNNRGLNVTNNIALRAARGRYIIRLDADDWLDVNALGVMVPVLERDSRLGLVFPDFFLVDEEGNLLEMVRRHNFNDVELLDQPAHGACTMIRRSCLEAIDGYDESFRCQDGYDLWIRFIEHFDVRNVNLPLFYYRQHARSLTRNEEKILSTRSKIIARQADRSGTRRRTLVIVPVRGAAADPNSLALRPLAGKPLIEWTVDAALAGERVADVLVSSPDANVLAHVEAAYGGRVLAVRRDPRLAMLNTFLDETVAHAVAEYSRRRAPPDVLAVLLVESPFRESFHIDRAVDVLELFETDAVVGVRPETGVFYRHDGTGLQPLRSTEFLRLESEELYREVGQIRVVSLAAFRTHGKVLAGRVGHVVLDERSALAILSELDWRIAEQVAEEVATERYPAAPVTP